MTTTPPGTVARSASADYLRSRWDDAIAAGLDPVARLVYRSNLLGADARITNTGGGNTSSKIAATDPLTGKTVRVLWVKGSGGDLRTATRANFASLYLDQVLSLRDIYARFLERGPKTPAEDAMVGMYPHTTFDRNPTPASIDTPLHGFIPHAHVDHLHPVAVMAIAAAARGPALTREAYGDDLIWTDWQRPGFDLGLKLERICREHPNAQGVILGGHGLICWADDDRECYERTLALIRRAEDFLNARDDGALAFGGPRVQPLPEADRRRVLVDVLPWLRGRVSRDATTDAPRGALRQIATVEMRDAVLEFVNSRDAQRLAELGTSCPDHFLRTKIKPLYVDWDPQAEDAGALKTKLEAGLAQYRRDYAEYYTRHKRENSPAMRQSSPSVVLIPGIGLVAWGKSKSEARVTAEFYSAAIGVMRGAERVSRYTALDPQEAFDIEYWLLEDAKLKRLPPERPLDRMVAVVVGAGSGIGRALVSELIDQGAAVAAVDLRADQAQAVAEEAQQKVGMGIGVAGTGISGAGQVVGLGADVTDRAAMRRALEDVVLAYGGLDHVVVTAGYYPSPDEHSNVADEEWEKTFAINVTGPFLVADEAWRVWQAQGELDGSLVITTSVNAVVPKAGSFAYDTSKAATNHLVRELAVAFAPLVRVNGVAPATVLEGSSMFPRERVIASLAKYGLPYVAAESTEVLRDRLAEFYAKRTLTGRPITLADQVKAIAALLGGGFSKTTGQIVNIDGGLAAAFLR